MFLNILHSIKLFSFFLEKNNDKLNLQNFFLSWLFQFKSIYCIFKAFINLQVDYLSYDPKEGFTVKGENHHRTNLYACEARFNNKIENVFYNIECKFQWKSVSSIRYKLSTYNQFH